MAKAFVVVVCILALAVWAEGSIENKIDHFVDRASANIECHMGSDDACLRSFYLEHQTEILVGCGAALLILVACFLCCRCCCGEKRGIVYLQMPRPAATSNAYKV